MNKVVFNSSYGGFSLSKEAAEWLVEHGSDKIRIYSVSELNKCYKRWIAVYPVSTLLKELECTCGAKGYVIKTGQTINEQ